MDAGIAPEYPYDDQCVLWDKTCTGNITEAEDMFFGDTDFALQKNACFMNQVPVEECGKYESPQWMSRFQEIKDWMRKPECQASSSEWDSRVGEMPFSKNVAGDGGSCCNFCNLYAGKVDIYYWPQPGANTSCLDVVGTTLGSFSAPYTTDDGAEYWTCSITGSVSDGYHHIFTAQLQSGVKQYMYNPWDPSPCTANVSEVTGGNALWTPTALPHPTQQSSHSMLNLPSGMNADGSPITTVVSDGYTL